jgi:hypothetical protein
MRNTDQVLQAIEDLSFCAECHVALDREKDFYSQCNTCDELLCPKCSKCACDSGHPQPSYRRGCPVTEVAARGSHAKTAPTRGYIPYTLASGERA